MSSQHQKANQLGKNKSDERTRVTHNNNDTRSETNNSIIDSCMGPRSKRKRPCSKNRFDRTDSLDNLVVYDRKAKEVVRVNISDSCKSHNETNNNNNRKENFNNNTTTNTNKRVHRTTGPIQTVYGEGNDTDKVDCLVMKSNNYYSNNESQRHEISSRRGGEGKKSGCFQHKGKVVNKSSAIKGLSSTKANKNKKDQQKQEEIIATIKTPSSLKKKIISGSVQTTQRTTPHRKTHRERKWNNKWKLDFPWLEQGINHKGREVGMCLYCRSAEKKNSFANDGSTNLQYSAFQRHQTNREHRQAMLEKQILKQGTKTVEYSTNLKTGSISTECVSLSTLPPSSKQKQPENKVIINQDELLKPPSSDFFYLTNQASPAPLLHRSMVQPVYSSLYQHRPITSHPSYSTAYIDSVNKTQSSRSITSFYDDDNDDQNTPKSPQRVFLLSKKTSPLQLSGDVLIFQVGVG